jgi:hypothetical protein
MKENKKMQNHFSKNKKKRKRRQQNNLKRAKTNLCLLQKELRLENIQSNKKTEKAC